METVEEREQARPENQLDRIEEKLDGLDKKIDQKVDSLDKKIEALIAAGNDRDNQIMQILAELAALREDMGKGATIMTKRKRGRPEKFVKINDTPRNVARSFFGMPSTKFVKQDGLEQQDKQDRQQSVQDRSDASRPRS